MGYTSVNAFQNNIIVVEILEDPCGEEQYGLNLPK
jgi:hypothetical protein